MRKHYRRLLTDTEIQIQNEKRKDFEAAVINQMEIEIGCTTSEAQGFSFFDQGITIGFLQGWTANNTANHIIKQSTTKTA